MSSSPSFRGRVPNTGGMIVIGMMPIRTPGNPKCASSAGSQGVAIDGRDQRLGIAVDQEEERPEPAAFERLLQRRTRTQELLQIGAGAEGIAGSGDDHGANRRVLPGSRQRAVQSLDHRGAKGVAHLRLTQPKGENAAGPLFGQLARR